jgi:hypothetical protein
MPGSAEGSCSWKHQSRSPRLNQSVLGIPTRPRVVDSLLQFATVDLTLGDEDAAFGMLRERSGASNRKLVHLAAAVVDVRRLLATQPGVR